MGPAGRPKPGAVVNFAEVRRKFRRQREECNTAQPRVLTLALRQLIRASETQGWAQGLVPARSGLNIEVIED